MTGLENLQSFDSDETSPRYYTNAQEVIRLATTSASVPSFRQEVIKIGRGNQIINFAGKPEFSSGSVVINDYVGARSLDMLMAWQKLSYDLRKQAVGRASEYKKTCYLNVYDSNNKLIRTYTMYGCWISDLPQDAFAQGKGDTRQITATIQYDTYTMGLPEIL